MKGNGSFVAPSFPHKYTGISSFFLAFKLKIICHYLSTLCNIFKKIIYAIVKTIVFEYQIAEFQVKKKNLRSGFAWFLFNDSKIAVELTF